MTEKLYYLDSHMFEFEAEVLECRELERGWGIILDRTAFFPEALTASSACAACRITPAST